MRRLDIAKNAPLPQAASSAGKRKANSDGYPPAGRNGPPSAPDCEFDYFAALDPKHCARMYEVSYFLIRKYFS
jgi:hypothetical protein